MKKSRKKSILTGKFVFRDWIYNNIYPMTKNKDSIIEIARGFTSDEIVDLKEVLKQTKNDYEFRYIYDALIEDYREYAIEDFVDNLEDSSPEVMYTVSILEDVINIDKKFMSEMTVQQLLEILESKVR